MPPENAISSCFNGNVHSSNLLHNHPEINFGFVFVWKNKWLKSLLQQSLPLNAMKFNSEVQLGQNESGSARNEPNESVYLIDAWKMLIDLANYKTVY